MSAAFWRTRSLCQHINFTITVSCSLLLVWMLVLFYYFIFFAISPLLKFNSGRLGESVKCCSVIVIEVTLSHVNKRFRSRLPSCDDSFFESRLFQMEIQQKYCTRSSCSNVYSSVNRLQWEKPRLRDPISAFTVYSIVQHLWKMATFTWILCYVLCFVIMECNCATWPLYFKNTLFFTSSIYLYVSMYVCTEKKTNVYFLYLSMHVLMPFIVHISLCKFNFIKQLYLIFLLNVCVRIQSNHIPMQFHVGNLYGNAVTIG